MTHYLSVLFRAVFDHARRAARLGTRHSVGLMNLAISSFLLDPIYTTSDEFWKRRFHSKNASSVKTQQSLVTLALFLRKTPSGKSRLSWGHRFRNFCSVSKCFPSSRQWKTGVFKFALFQERFRKSLFSWRISVDGRPNCVFKFLRCSVDAVLNSMFSFFLVLFISILAWGSFVYGSTT